MKFSGMTSCESLEKMNKQIIINKKYKIDYRCKDFKILNKTQLTKIIPIFKKEVFP